jgi:hypothetical protein
MPRCSATCCTAWTTGSSSGESNALTTLSVLDRSLCSPHGQARRPLPFGEQGTRPTPMSAHMAISSGSSWRRSRFVLVLHRYESGPPAERGGMLKLGELPGVHRRRSEIARLAGAHDVVQSLHRLLNRGVRVEAVNLIEVDVVGVEPEQRGVNLLQDGLTGQALPAGAVVHPAPHVGGQDDVLAAGVPPDRPPDEFLGRAGLRCWRCPRR